jgi:hypothetical protein
MLARMLTRAMDAQGVWTKPLGDLVHRFLFWLLQGIPALRDLLVGRWLGHPLHAVLTDAPIGILFLVIVFDALSMPDAADWALIVGILTMLGAALAGFADYADTDGKARERATLHSSLMLLALVGYLVSLVLRQPVSAGSSAIHFVPAPRKAWRLTMFPSTYTTSPPTYAPAARTRKLTRDTTTAEAGAWPPAATG